MTALGRRDWVPGASEDYILEIAGSVAGQSFEATQSRIEALITENRIIHERDCVNLNPATNVMNPKAEAVLSAGLGARPSLGYPGDKYEMGLEAIEQIEVIAAELAAEVFGAKYAEIRVPSGAIANLYAFMAAAKPGECIIAPPGEIGGHVTHHGTGAAGLYGIITHPAPVDPERYTVDLDKLRQDALRLRPKLISIGGSLNLFPHPIREIRAIADEVGALVLFDAAHMSGMIAGHGWQQPLAEGAHLMTMSTYKSLGGPPSGLIVTNDADIARKLDAIAYPGLTANFDAAKSASLAITLLDWKQYGRAYAQAMAETAKALGEALVERQMPVFARDRGITTSHQFAIEAAAFGGGQAAAKILRQVNILSCGIGLPIAPVAGDVNGLRLGTPEIVRFGMTVADMPELAAYIAEGLSGARPVEAVAKDVTAFRRRFTTLHFMR
ncbi:aminotransferase class I/II-fold pyridoxal phosphate-dependent enzyme [Bosea caraganae]|uniref:Aminotransferase class I/II-fold pyridoxal phosphate-dependent enzyme n=1 Tax=Bosea caraganae TaxID=2763117 RepID=A0A370LDJ6_9HYPH|nr:aminotransferase class I/II-fold pyridoxal phosphate-dependent enzyme [Bosea caraganae]RDJ27887.1 aminotransferase class I/II-fold pyridoxal phosphate-dependent enzyme [Bosea caraganae]RDJ29899.1 aminotransferase class I/II-fold pyridoxal phosphate-dependent enzyme [Bosea caraganae]